MIDDPINPGDRHWKSLLSFAMIAVPCHSCNLTQRTSLPANLTMSEATDLSKCTDRDPIRFIREARWLTHVNLYRILVGMLYGFCDRHLDSRGDLLDRICRKQASLLIRNDSLFRLISLSLCRTLLFLDCTFPEISGIPFCSRNNFHWF